MIESLNRLNDKVTKAQNSQKSGGYLRKFSFPGYFDCYPCLSEFSDKFWKETYHTERNIEYFKDDFYWLSKQLFVVSNRIKSENFYLDFEYYSIIESISVLPFTTTSLTISVNNLNTLTFEINDLLVINDYNITLMPLDNLIVQANNEIYFQIKYRVIG